MATITNELALVTKQTLLENESLWIHLFDWLRTELVWYAGSFSIHLFALSLLLLLPNLGTEQNQGDATTFTSQANEETAKGQPDSFQNVELGQLEEDLSKDLIVDRNIPPSVRKTESIELPSSPTALDRSGIADSKRDSAIRRIAAIDFGHGPLMVGPDHGRLATSGTRTIWSHRGNVKDGLASDGGSPRAQHAVNAALAWLANHQLSDGSWSLQTYTQRCSDASCTGAGDVRADAGATAFGLLPFLAAAQTHKTPCPYKLHVRKGLDWLIRHQQPDGNLAKGAEQRMYSHALATISLCEAYGLTGDSNVGRSAQGAVNFILAAQNTTDGGWRYNPKDPGDTSVVGWQLMALKSAHMAGLEVGGSAFSGTSKWLDSVATRDGIEYGYQPGTGPSPTMTSVGLLCRQYLGAKRDDPRLVGGMGYLLHHLPDESFSNIYYWYYATQVMHNMSGSEWDTWNRKMRDLLVRTQIRDSNHCANGSWSPEKDAWGRRGGRLMQTSLATLTLEIYYRYLPLFKDVDQPR
jgi:hypothetical protein